MLDKMTILDELIKELSERGFLNISPRELQKNNLGIICKKYNEKLFKENDNAFLIGFYEGFKSETGIPTGIIKQINKNIIT
jgi:hypothetical protein